MKFKDLIKSIFSLKTVLGCYISAIGYGLGYAFPVKLGLNQVLCIIICLICGFITGWVSNLIFESNVFKNNKRRQILLAIAIYIVYIASWFTADTFLGVDLDFDFLTDLKFTIIFQIVAFIIEFIKEYRKRNKVNK